MEEEEEGGASILYRCPISMELMEDPVTISTGITYDRKNINKWFFSYNKSTCPATMQRLQSFDLTPNHTLKRLIGSWQSRNNNSNPSTTIEHDNLLSLLTDIESAPFKMSSLKKLQTVVETSESARTDFIASGGIQVLIRIMSQIVLSECADFSAFRACEESVGVLHFLPLSDPTSVEKLSDPECMKPMMLVLQRGSAEARLHTMTILLKLSKTGKDWMPTDRELDVTKSLLELLSDDISTKLSSAALDVLIEIVGASKRNRRKAVEAGAVCVTIELLAVASRNKCEKMLVLLKRLCDCPEGRSAFVDHGLGVAVVSKKILRVSEFATKLGVKILSVVCDSMPTEKVIDEMMVFGAVRKLFGLLHIDGRSSTKDKAMKMIRLHGGAWKKYPCFPCEIKEYLKLVHV